MVGYRCPICAEEYTNIKRSQQVCVFHQNWIVTVCINCGKNCFVEPGDEGVCYNCKPEWMKMTANEYTLR